MKIFHAEIEIDGSAAQVWEQIADLAGYAEWNPFIAKAEGKVAEGAIVQFQMATQPGTLRAKVVKAEPNRELTLATLIPLGLLRPRYTQRIEPVSEGKVRYVCREEFRGPLVLLVGRRLERENGPLYATTCAAMKQRVERKSKL